jgi:hypothetical protein
LPSDETSAGPSGFQVSSAVDLYDRQTGQWSTALLSEKRSDLAATSVGNVAIFAGGRPIGNPVFFCVTKDLFFVWFCSDDACLRCFACLLACVCAAAGCRLMKLLQYLQVFKGHQPLLTCTTDKRANGRLRCSV